MADVNYFLLVNYCCATIYDGEIELYNYITLGPMTASEQNTEQNGRIEISAVRSTAAHCPAGWLTMCGVSC